MKSDGKKTYTKKVDIWSMGCILYELATGQHAFPNAEWDVLCLIYERKKNKEVILEDT